MARFTRARRTNPLAGMKFETDAGWERATNMVNSINPKVRRAFDFAMTEISKKFIKQIHEAIDTSGANYNWQPLSDKYKKIKSQKGGNPGIMNWDGILKRSFSISRGSKHQVLIGIPAGIQPTNNVKRTNHYEVAHILNILEHGIYHLGIPARPLISPSWKAIGGKYYLKTTVKKHINIQLGKGGI